MEMLNTQHANKELCVNCLFINWLNFMKTVSVGEKKYFRFMVSPRQNIL